MLTDLNNIHKNMAWISCWLVTVKRTTSHDVTYNIIWVKHEVVHHVCRCIFIIFMRAYHTSKLLYYFASFDKWRSLIQKTTNSYDKTVKSTIPAIPPFQIVEVKLALLSRRGWVNTRNNLDRSHTILQKIKRRVFERNCNIGILLPK